MTNHIPKNFAYKCILQVLNEYQNKRWWNLNLVMRMLVNKVFLFQQTEPYT